jgi:predicted DNA-binding ribbon-helix-helix protein
MTGDLQADLESGWAELSVRLPANTWRKLEALALRRGVSLSVLIDEFATLALFEDELAQRLDAGPRAGGL